MLTNWLRKVTRGIVQPIARVLIRLGASPNLLTILGCLINLAAAVIIALVDLRWGALVLAVAMFFDAFDGAVAREMNRVTAFGGFLDSSLDRVSEFSVLLALAWRCLQSTEPRNALLALVATFGSMMVSYARARAEGIGVLPCGLLSRVERHPVTDRPRQRTGGADAVDPGEYAADQCAAHDLCLSAIQQDVGS